MISSKQWEHRAPCTCKRRTTTIVLQDSQVGRAAWTTFLPLWSVTEGLPYRNPSIVFHKLCSLEAREPAYHRLPHVETNSHSCTHSYLQAIKKDQSILQCTRRKCRLHTKGNSQARDSNQVPLLHRATPCTKCRQQIVDASSTHRVTVVGISGGH